MRRLPFHIGETNGSHASADQKNVKATPKVILIISTALHAFTFKFIVGSLCAIAAFNQLLSLHSLFQNEPANIEPLVPVLNHNHVIILPTYSTTQSSEESTAYFNGHDFSSTGKESAKNRLDENNNITEHKKPIQPISVISSSQYLSNISSHEQNIVASLKEDIEDEKSIVRNDKFKNGGTEYSGPVQSIYVVPREYTKDKGIGELKHFIFDGIDKSPRLRMTKNMDEKSAIWIIELVRADKLGRQCEDIVPFVERSLLRRWKSAADDMLLSSYDKKNEENEEDEKDFVETNMKKENHSFKMFIVDYHDSGYARFSKCSLMLSSLLGKKNIYYATRKTTNGRAIKYSASEHKDETERIGRQGRLIDFKRDYMKHTENHPRALKYGVRSDIVHEINNAKQLILFESNATNNLATDDITLLPRPNDVAHFWNEGADEQNGSFRSEINRVINGLSKNNSLAIQTSILGSRGPFGRNNANFVYVAKMLRMKIVVVCQRDFWEGHYRLMEALASGAMVMTDPMHPLPAYLEDEESLVVYHSMAELKDKIMYYLSHTKDRLKIARLGYEIVMEYHQSAAYMERLIFGNWSTLDGL